MHWPLICNPQSLAMLWGLRELCIRHELTFFFHFPGQSHILVGVLGQSESLGSVINLKRMSGYRQRGRRQY